MLNEPEKLGAAALYVADGPAGMSEVWPVRMPGSNKIRFSVWIGTTYLGDYATRAEADAVADAAAEELSPPGNPGGP